MQSIFMQAWEALDRQRGQPGFKTGSRGGSRFSHFEIPGGPKMAGAETRRQGIEGHARSTSRGFV